MTFSRKSISPKLLVATSPILKISISALKKIVGRAFEEWIRTSDATHRILVGAGIPKSHKTTVLAASGGTRPKTRMGAKDKQKKQCHKIGKTFYRDRESNSVSENVADETDGRTNRRIDGHAYVFSFSLSLFYMSTSLDFDLDLI